MQKGDKAGETVPYTVIILKDGKTETIGREMGIMGRSGVWIDYKAKTFSESKINVYTPLYYNNSVIGVISGILGGQKDLLPLILFLFL